MKLRVNVKPMLIELDILKNEVYINSVLSNVYWKTESIDIDGKIEYKTHLVCRDYNHQNESEDWIPNDNGRIYSFIHERKNPNIQFLGFWIQRCLKNVNNYYDILNSDIN